MLDASVETAPATGADVFAALWKSYRTFQAIIDESASKEELCDSDIRALQTLMENGPLPVNIVGTHVSLTTGSITTAIDRLEAKWLVARKNHPRDRRMRIVDLTPKGKRLVERATARQAKGMEVALSALSQQQRRQLLLLLDRIPGDRVI